MLVLGVCAANLWETRELLFFSNWSTESLEEMSSVPGVRNIPFPQGPTSLAMMVTGEREVDAEQPSALSSLSL